MCNALHVSMLPPFPSYVGSPDPKVGLYKGCKPVLDPENDRYCRLDVR